MRVLLLGLIAIGAAGCAGDSAMMEVDGVRYVGRSFTPTEQDGAVVLECVVMSDGRLSDCVVLSEQPEGQGFAEVALRGAAEARVRIGDTSRVGQKMRYTTHLRASSRRP